jgi:dolichol-phosphate mannosyltransferase
MSRYRHRPLHLFGGLGLILGTIGTVILVYLTIVKITGEPIGRRPLLLLGVLLVVVGIQFLSLGLLSELVTSQHRERSRASEDRPSRLVDEILR